MSIASGGGATASPGVASTSGAAVASGAARAFLLVAPMLLLLRLVIRQVKDGPWQREAQRTGGSTVARGAIGGARVFHGRSEGGHEVLGEQ